MHDMNWNSVFGGQHAHEPDRVHLGLADREASQVAYGAGRRQTGGTAITSSGGSA